MGQLTRKFDWSHTTIGKPDQWPQSLRITVSNMLRSKFPMFLWWGEEMIQFYNDAYRPSLGTSGKHPSALGAKGRETWPEIWGIISPLMHQVETTGEATWMKDQLVPIYRNGKIEDVYWTYSYSSVLDDEGNHGGILVTCMETTESVIGQQKIEKSQQELLHLFEESVAIAKISKDDDLVFQYANSFYGMLVGRKPGDIIGKPLLEALPEIKGQGFDDLLKEVIRTAKPFIAKEVAFDIFRKEKIETTYVNLAYQPRIEADGSIEGILVVATDVSEQVISRKIIEESEAKYRMLFESMDQGYCTLEILFEGEQCVDYRYLETNPTFERHLGMSNALGKTIREIAPDIEPKWFNFYGGVALTGKAIRIEEESKAFNKWFEVYAVRIGGAEERKVGVFFTDVTERKRAEEVLRQSEARFRSIIEQAPVAIALTNGADLIFESINLPMLQVINRSKEEVVGKKLAEVLPELKSQPVYDILLHVLQTGESFMGTEVATNLVKEGISQRRYFNVSYTRIVEASGVNSVLHMALDVSEQVLARRKIEESEAKLRSILNSAPTAMGVFVGPDLVVENPNQFLIDVMAAGPGIEGESFRELLAGLVDEDQKFIELVDGVRTTGQPFEAQEVGVFFKAEKKTRYFNISFIPLRDESGEVYAVLDVSVDVTQQFEARQTLEEKEAALEAALEQVRLSKEAAELGTFDMDLEKGDMHWDQRCRTLFGISHKQPVSFELDFIKRLHADDQDRVVEVVRRAYSKSVSNGDYDVEYRTLGAEDGVERWVRAKGKVYFNSNDKPVRFIGSVLDITEKVTAIQKIERLVEERTKQLAQVNESLLQANKELQRSNANLEEFTYAASHDLKEPIRKITIFNNQLRAQLTDRLAENENRLFGRIQNATERMGNLIDDLLLYSHVTQRPQETESIDLNQRIQRVLEDLELDIEEKGAIIQVAKLPMVKGYRRQLQQLFQNLISNALKYSKTDEAPHIAINATAVTESGKPYHVVTIKDNGIGFEEQYADKIFQLFNRLHGKAEYSGTGVGLSIVKKVVENHNGFIRVESSPGIGSMFHIYLPANK